MASKILKISETIYKLARDKYAIREESLNHNSQSLVHCEDIAKKLFYLLEEFAKSGSDFESFDTLDIDCDNELDDYDDYMQYILVIPMKKVVRFRSMFHQNGKKNI